MNINCKMSKLIRKIEKRLNKENIVNNKYFVIKRECKNAPLGLFAYYIAVLARIEYAIAHGMIPVIDMKNYKNTFHEDDEVGKINTWELFFEQPYGIGVDEALASKNARYVWNDVPEFHPNESLDFLYNDELVNYYHILVSKYMKFKPEVLNILKEKEKEILGTGNERILGVLARGTDYTNLRPYYHPVQPKVEALIEKVDEYCQKYDCKKIYIATEDEEILNKFVKRYGKRILYTDQKRVSDVKTYLNENEEFANRKAFERGIEYLTSIYLLAQCNGLIAGRTSGTVGACIMAEKYEFKYIFALGRYGIEDKILEHKENVK